MADMLGIKVSLDLDVMEASRDLTSQINKLTIPPVVVDLQIGKVLGLNELQNEDFSTLRRNFQDAFTLSNGTLSDFRGSMESIERILSSKITEGTVNKFKELSNTLSTLGSSFEVDNTVLSRFEKVNDMLKEFNSLSKEAQSVLLKKSNATAKGNVDDLTDKVKSDSRMSIKEFQNAIINQQNAIDRALQQSSDKNIKSITRYLDATEGLKEIVRKQLDTWQTLTEQTFADGSKVGKITVDIESNLKKMEKAYESSVASIRKYSAELYKAIDTGDLDKVSNLQNVIGVFEETRDKIKKEVANSPFSEQMAEKFLGIDTLNKYLLDMANNSYDKGVSDKEIKKATDSYLSSVKEKAKELDSLNRELKKAKVDGLTEYANELVKEVNKARSQLSKLLNMDTVKSIYPDDIGSRMQLRKQASDIVETYEDVTRMFRTKMDNIQSKKLEESGLNTFLADFKKNATEIESLEKKLATALNSGEFDYASDLQKRVDALNLQQKALKENAQSLAQYEKALKDIQAVEQKSKDNVELYNSYLENKSKIQQQKAESKLLEQQQAENSKQRANELKAMSKAQEQYWNDLLKYEDSIAKGYESVTKTLAKKQNEYIQAIADDNISSAHSLQKSVEYWNNKKNEILSEINKTNFTQDFYDRINNIDAQNNLFISEFESKLTDKLNKKELQESSKALEEFVDEYDRLYKQLTNEKLKVSNLSQKDRDIEASAHKKNISRLEAEIEAHKKKADALKLSAKAQEEIKRINAHYDNELTTGLSKVSQNAQIQEYKEFKKEQDEILARYKQLYNEQEKFNKALSKSTSIDMYEKNKGEVEKLSNELEKLESQITSLGHKEDLAIFKADKSIAESRELSQAIEKVRTEANSLLDNLEKLSNSGLVDKSSLENLKATVTQLSNVNLDGTVEDIREMNVQLSKSKEAYKELKQAMENTKWESDRNIKLTEVFDQVNKFKNDFGSVIDSSSLRALEESAERLAKTLDKDSFTKGAKELTAQLKHARNEMDGLVSSSEKYNFFEDLYDNMRTFQLGDLIVDGVQDALYNVKDIIVDLDSAMANVKKVAIPIDVDSVQKLEDIKNRAIEISKEVGMASTDVINAIADTIQTSGYAMEEAIEIARQTMMLANVGEMSQESATEGVVSMLSGFKLQPLKEMSVVVDGVTKSTNQLTDAMDQVNYVGNNFAISTEGILDAFKGGGTVLSEYGVSLTETVALITGANKTLQDPTVVGNGLKSIAINLQGIKTDAYTGELALNKTAMSLEKMAGIDVYSDKQKGQIKSMIEIMDELYKKWDSFTDEERAGLSESIAGKQQSRVFQSLMSNYEEVLAIRKEISEQGLHFGSAEAEK